MATTSAAKTSRSKQRSRSMTPSRGVNGRSPSGTPPLLLPPSAMTPPPYFSSLSAPSASCHDFVSDLQLQQSLAAASGAGRPRMEHSNSAPDGYLASHYLPAPAIPPAARYHHRTGVNSTHIAVTSGKAGYYRSQYSDMISEWRNELHYGRMGNGFDAAATSGGNARAATIGSHGNGIHSGYHHHHHQQPGVATRGYGAELAASERLGLSTARLYTLLVST